MYLMNRFDVNIPECYRRIFQAIRLVIVLVAAGMIVPVLHAQYDTATVVGTVSDSQGANVRNAQVALRNADSGVVLTRVTNGAGDYQFTDVQIGTYTVTVDAPGFAQSATKPFNVVVSARQRIDVSLSVGAASETVTVSAGNTGLQVESGEQSTTIEGQEIVDLPLNGREYTDLALLVPGVQVGSLQTGDVDQRRGSLVVHGVRSTANNFLLDGLDNNSYQLANQGFNNQAIPESVDAVQQYTVITSNFAAEYGRAGGAVINVKTKSGTKVPHALLYEYIRNTALDAYGPFYGNGTKPALIQNQFGGTFSWQVPHVKDFFYFIDYEGFRQATRTITSSTIPTIDQRNGILYNETGQIVPVQNPFTGKQYPTGAIPLTDFTPFAAAVLAALPTPTKTLNPGTGVNFVATGPGHNYRDIGDIRLDKYFGNRLQAFVRASKQSIHIVTAPNITGPAGGGGSGKVRVLTTSGVAGATYVVTPNSVADVRVGVTYAESGKVPYNQGIPNFYDRFNIPYPVPSSLTQSGLNSQALLSFSTFGTQATQNQFSNPNTYNLKTSYTLAKGKHSFTFGYEYLLLSELASQGSPFLGEDTYKGQFSYYAASGRPGSSTGRKQAYAMADFIFGARDSYQLSTYNAPTSYYDFHYAYAEDSWRVFPKLTLTYGLRYEFTTPERARDIPIVNFDPTTNALKISRDGSIYDEALVDPKLNSFAPRFGFAYSLYPNIVVRGGYGLSFIQWSRYGGESELQLNGPYSINAIVNQTLAQPLCADGSLSLSCFHPTMQGYPTSLISPASFSTANSATRYVPRNAVPGYVQSYSLGTQIQMDKSTILSLAYVGNHSVHTRVLADYNEAALQLPGQSLTLAQRRPIHNFSDIYASLSVGYSRYNALQAQLTRRAGSLFIINSLTWSKGIDNAAADLESAHGDSAYVPIRNIGYNASISGYNQTLNDSFSAIWTLPFGRRVRNTYLRNVVSGWRLTSITRLTSGVPINITYDPSDTDVTTDLAIAYRPNYIGPIYTIVNPRSKWTTGGSCTGYCNVFNTSQLSAPSSASSGGTTPYGNLPRNAVTGPSYYDIDLGMQKNIKLPEQMQLQLRFDSFNLLNHTNFKSPGTDLSSSSTFGVFAPGSSSVFPSRQLQIALRLSY